MTKLYILEGPNKGESFELKDETTTIGRSHENHIQMKDRFVSRKHLEISRRDSKFFLKDLMSENGTFVDGEPIKPGKELEVKQGLPISIGMSVLCVGEGCTEYILAFLDSLQLSKELSEKVGEAQKDRPMTAKRNMELIYKVSHVLGQTLDINDILEKILAYIFDLLKRIDRGAIILVNSNTGETKKVIIRNKEGLTDNRMRYSEAVVERVLETGKPVMIPDAQAEDVSEVAETLELVEIGSVMCVPLISKAEIRGVIYVDSLQKPYGFRREDLSLLTALSSPAAIAIENALLHERLEKVKRDEDKM
ncbi:MAG: FHA domain-containing protein [Desulfobacteraceae bacterium]|jgi:pSer/pThr/pTyr-binding forkhead associated (FHA) protein